MKVELNRVQLQRARTEMRRLADAVTAAVPQSTSATPIALPSLSDLTAKAEWMHEQLPLLADLTVVAMLLDADGDGHTTVTVPGDTWDPAETIREAGDSRFGPGFVEATGLAGEELAELLLTLGSVGQESPPGSVMTPEELRRFIIDHPEVAEALQNTRPPYGEGPAGTLRSLTGSFITAAGGAAAAYEQRRLTARDLFANLPRRRRHPRDDVPVDRRQPARRAVREPGPCQHGQRGRRAGRRAARAGEDARRARGQPERPRPVRAQQQRPRGTHQGPREADQAVRVDPQRQPDHRVLRSDRRRGDRRAARHDRQAHSQRRRPRPRHRYGPGGLRGRRRPVARVPGVRPVGRSRDDLVDGRRPARRRPRRRARPQVQQGARSPADGLLARPAPRDRPRRCRQRPRHGRRPLVRRRGGGSRRAERTRRRPGAAHRVRRHGPRRPQRV